MKRRTPWIQWTLPIVLLLCGSATQSHAQTDEQRAAARSLATEGATAFKESRYKDAVDLFTKAESLVHAPPHVLFLARAHTKLGQLVKAREEYLKIAREDMPPSVPQPFRDAKAAAAREVASIESKIGGLTIKVEGAESAKDLQVKVDGTPIPSVMIGASQPIDPGEHRIEALATGFRSLPQSTVVGEGEKATITLKFDPDPTAVAASSGAVAPGAISVSGSPDSAPAPVVASSDSGVQGSNGARIGAYAAFAAGAVGIGVGTVFLLKSGSKRSEADNLCSPKCPAGSEDKIHGLDSDADSARTVGIIALAAGGAGVVTGSVLLLVGGKSESTSARVQPWVGVNTIGIAGRF